MLPMKKISSNRSLSGKNLLPYNFKTLFMGYYQKFVTTFAGKSLFSTNRCMLCIVRYDPKRASFSGEWKSRGVDKYGRKYCLLLLLGDRMLAKTMKIAEQVNFLTIEVSSSFPGTTPVTSQEKLTFDEVKASEIKLIIAGNGQKSTVKLSADGQMMTVNSIVFKMVPHSLPCRCSGTNGCLRNRGLEVER